MNSLPFLFLLSIAVYATSEPCPFNKKCNCIKSNAVSSASLSFDSVDCKSDDGKLPQFDPAPEGKYHIYYDFSIDNADLRVIPAKHFSPFEYIQYLHLNHKSDSPSEAADINWDDGAFDGVQLVGIFTDGLDGLIPVPVALKNVGLNSLYVNNGRTPISIKDDSFKNSLGLQSVTVSHTTIHETKPKAFSGLEDTLQMISFENSDIRGIDSLKDALKNMNKLITVDLAYNSITEVKSDSFPEITIPNLYLHGNPIEKIDKKSFTTLNELRFVSLHTIQSLTSADMATFTGLKTDSFTATFYSDKSLKTVVVSNSGEFPKNTTIDFGATGIETIDPKIADLIEKYPNMFLFLDQNTHLKCEGLEWMSKLECPSRIWIDGSTCADKQGQKLADYLKSVDPESKCLEKLSLLLEMRGNLAQERQRRIGYRRQF